MVVHHHVGILRLRHHCTELAGDDDDSDARTAQAQAAGKRKRAARRLRQGSVIERNTVHWCVAMPYFNGVIRTVVCRLHKLSPKETIPMSMFLCVSSSIMGLLVKSQLPFIFYYYVFFLVTAVSFLNYGCLI